ALGNASMSDPRIPIVANVNARPVTSAAEAGALLVEQLTAPVQWTRVMQRLVGAYPDALFVEMGTGNVLTGLAKRIAPGIRTATCGTVADIETLLETAGAHA
ncbi:MAG: malonyl CoA-acyl carrier protein transacylase, partial [Gemmatimonas sp.]